MKLAEKCKVRVPYQIWASGWWKAPNSSNNDPLLSTPLGTAEVYCSISGERIEKDKTEIGKPRMHCIDKQNIDHSMISHKQITTIRSKLNEKLSSSDKTKLQKIINLLNIIDPYENLLWIEENAHFWHLRTSIDENPVTPGEFIKNACSSYQNRIALGIPKENNQIHPRLQKSPFVQAASMNFIDYDDFSWITYSQIYELSIRIARFLIQLPEIKEGSKIGICGYNNIEWAICDFACALIGCVSVGK